VLGPAAVAAPAGPAAGRSTARPATRDARAPSALPADPEVAALYLHARDNWALRTPAGLRSALAEMGEVVSREPRFARGYTGLADAYLLAREYDAVPGPVAYAKAKAAAQAALALDPQLADAHRALGFIEYWSEHDPAAAGASFRAARRFAPNDVQTHHWYGNVLASNGQFDAALRELDSARLLDPGSVSIRSDIGWAQWSRGDDAEARRTLADVIHTQPNYCSPHRYLSVMDFAAGDYAGYLREHALEAATCGNPKTYLRSVQEAAAFASKGATGLRQTVSKEAQDAAADPHANHDWTAFVATLLRDRRQMVAALRTADQRREAWTWAAGVTRMEAAWRGDTEVQALLAHRRQARVE
jgi:tetratricopeptide (TPR) repeat protein